jgi:hypothetical protein
MEEHFQSILSSAANSMTESMVHVVYQNLKSLAKCKTEDDVRTLLSEQMGLKEPETSVFGFGVTPDATKGAKDKKEKVKNPRRQDFSLDKWIDHYTITGAEPICGNMGTKEDTKDLICAAVLTSEEITKLECNQSDDKKKYRCAKCKSAKGKLDKMLEKTTLTASIPKNQVIDGFNRSKGTLNVVEKTEKVEKAEENIPVITINGITDYVFMPETSLHKGLVIEVTGDKEVCIGKLVDEDGKAMKLNKNSSLKKDWLKSLKPLSLQEKEYVYSELEIKYKEPEESDKEDDRQRRNRNRRRNNSDDEEK